MIMNHFQNLPGCSSTAVLLFAFTHLVIIFFNAYKIYYIVYFLCILSPAMSRRISLFKMALCYDVTIKHFNFDIHATDDY